jgi:hypothetical protein
MRPPEALRAVRDDAPPATAARCTVRAGLVRTYHFEPAAGARVGDVRRERS